jgi:hypothetical protein
VQNEPNSRRVGWDVAAGARDAGQMRKTNPICPAGRVGRGAGGVARAASVQNEANLARAPGNGRGQPGPRCPVGVRLCRTNPIRRRGEARKLASRSSEDTLSNHPPSPRPSALRLPPGHFHPLEAGRRPVTGCAGMTESTRGLRTHPTHRTVLCPPSSVLLSHPSHLSHSSHLRPGRDCFGAALLAVTCGRVASDDRSGRRAAKTTHKS